MKWAEDESILRTFLRRIDDRRSPISNEIAIPCFVGALRYRRTFCICSNIATVIRHLPPTI
ncbi:MAG: hypothetical protein FWC89_10310 [Defluviitaleaceae bacterium]|nr:hypothetical protein [Defluviitaleaceae bacterium]